MENNSGLFDILKRTVTEFGEDDCMMMAASISYYAIFSLPPILFLVVTLAGVLFGQATVERELLGQARDMIGPAAAEQVKTMLNYARGRASGSFWPVLASLLALLFSATGVFVQLQAALNRTWGVAPDPDRGWGVFVRKRFLSFGMILGVAFLLLVSLVLSAAIAFVTNTMSALLPGFLSEGVAYSLDAAVGLVVFGGLFAAMFKWIPDAEIEWKDVRTGAICTALLFILGKELIAIYLGQANTGQSYGPAGALAVIMLWVFCASVILLLGAEFTQIWAQRFGREVLPEPGAVKVVREVRSVNGRP